MDRLQLKEQAKNAIRNALPNPALVTFSLFIMIVVLIAPQTILLEWQAGMHVAAPPIEILIIFSVGVQLLSSILMFGYTGVYALKVAQGEPAGYKNLFDGFYQPGKVLWLTILIGLFTFLWSLLFVIPGIVAAYRYRQAYFVLAQNKNVTALEALQISKKLMRGRKIDLFVLDLSFIGWAILCSLTWGILYIWKLPYFSVTYANFYRRLSSS